MRRLEWALLVTAAAAWDHPSPVAAAARDGPPPVSPGPVIIVTGLPHGGTSVASELIMTAPGLLGPFETGFLLAGRPVGFPGVRPFAK